MTGKIQSSTSDAQEAISALTGLEGRLTFQTVSFGESNVPAMISGKQLANDLMKNLSKVTTCVFTQAQKFPELAERIEQRDQADARSWLGPRP